MKKENRSPSLCRVGLLSKAGDKQVRKKWLSDSRCALWQKRQKVICMRVRKWLWQNRLCIKWGWFHPLWYRTSFTTVHFILWEDFLKQVLARSWKGLSGGRWTGSVQGARRHLAVVRSKNRWSPPDRRGSGGGLVRSSGVSSSERSWRIQMQKWKG